MQCGISDLRGAVGPNGAGRQFCEGSARGGAEAGGCGAVPVQAGMGRWRRRAGVEQQQRWLRARQQRGRKRVRDGSGGSSKRE